MSFNWTNATTERATVVLSTIKSTVKEYGVDIILETLIHIVGGSIKTLEGLEVNDVYLNTLKSDLQTALDNYRDRYKK